MIQMPDVNMSVFEEARRNQLVTEIDIQTQVALDGYQVQLSDIANPTQSQDNVVIDRFGKFLPHWNESLDFDTWVKMSMEVAGKQVLMLRGNSNVGGASDGNDTFIQWHGGATSDYHDTPVQDVPLIYEGSHKMTAASTQIYVGVSNIASFISYDSALYRILYNDENTQFSNTANDGTRTYNGTTQDLDSNIYYHTKIIAESASSIKFYIDNAYIDTITTNIPNEQLSLTVDVYAGSAIQAWSFIRKYTATEPIWASDGAEQNIAVALKSLGRAG